ncbi:MAG: formylglycine-generating enzyme family protein [Planctomycetota bacterium]
MPSEINYCDACGSIILPSAIENGSAVVNSAAMLCPDCLRKLSPDEREALSAPRAGAGTPGATPTTASARVASGRRSLHGSEDPRAGAPAEGTKARNAGPVVTAVAVGIGAAIVSALIGIHLLENGDSEPPRPRRATPTANAPTGPSKTPSSSGATGAARQLARIRAMIAMDDSKYAEARGMLVQFPKSFAGTPEVEGAKTLLSEIDAAYARRAEEALSAARASASADKFDEAERSIRAIGSRFGDGPWFESKGEAAVAEALAEVAKQRSEWELKNVVSTIEKARGELRAGRFDEAGKLIAGRAEWPADSRAKGEELAAEIERAVTAAAAAKKLALERATVLAEFDRLMMSEDYAGARDYAKSKAAEGGPGAKILRSGGAMAVKMAAEPAAILRGVKKLIGQETRLKMTKGLKTVTVKAANDTELTYAASFTINNRKRERIHRAKWDAIHPDQKAEFARLGGLELSSADRAVQMAYAALARDDFEAAEGAAGDAADTPLGKHLREVARVRITRRDYESAMKRARELVAKKQLEDAARECERALVKIPNDEAAVALLARIRRALAAPRTLTVKLSDDVTMGFIYIRAGTFVMGGDRTGDAQWTMSARPKHEVTITKPFYMGKYEVTEAQWKAVYGGAPKNSRGPDFPAVMMNHGATAGFCSRAAKKTGLKIRLPTEAEWEYACRAGTITRWSHGDDPSTLDEYAWTSENAGGSAHEVGQKKPNPWGFCDMYGNVEERVQDHASSTYYASSPKEDPLCTKGDASFRHHVLRGGGFPWGPDSCTSSSRVGAPHVCYRKYWGLRAAMTAEGEAPPPGGAQHAR